MNLRIKTLTALMCMTTFIAGRPAYGQILHYGVKAGPQLTSMKSDDKAFREQVAINPRIGYNAGFVLSFKVKDRYFFHTEYIYSTKGKVNRGKIDRLLEDRITYDYIEVPMLYNIHFRGKLGGARQFKWYAGAGPLLSYWLGGKGWINADEFAENSFPPFEYEIRFGERGEDIGETNAIYMKDVNRFQLGFNIGGGILLEPANAGKVMFDLRFDVGHTWMGTPSSADYVLPVTYDDNLKARNMALRFSVMYLFERNLDKKVRNKGKSNIVQKGNRMKRRR
ncbi:MAG TPA: outer membrane beta-barrel protein [Chryseosolibacter sp.]|nr:outer membrane beta-barrel protein [Chryseosolibacter sp.]